MIKLLSKLKLLPTLIHLLFYVSFAEAQLNTNSPILGFFDRDNLPIVFGYVVDLDRNQITVKDGWDEFHKLKTKELSASTQKQISDYRRFFNQVKKNQSNQLSLLSKLDSGTKKGEALRKLKSVSKLGIANPKTEQQLLSIVAISSDEEIAYACIITYLNIAELNSEKLKTLIDVIRRNKKLESFIKYNPLGIIIALGNAEESALPILKNAAFTGEMHLNINEEEASQTPLTINNGGLRHQTRIYATTALCRMESGQSAINSIVNLIYPINGQVNDPATFRAIYTEFAVTGKPITGMHGKLFQRGKEFLPNIAAQWQRNEKKGGPKNNLESLSRMKRFSTKDSEFLEFGEVLQASNDSVTIRNQKRETKKFRLDELSESDQKWIKENARSK